MDINYIYTKIKDREPYINGWEEMKRASVIVPIVNIEERAYILFQVRSKKMRKQPGDICFPGGGIEKDETPKEAALREIKEELGFKSIDIIKELDILVRHNRLMIHPFLAEIKDIEELKINEEEVDSVFCVPIDELINIQPIVSEGKLIPKVSDDFPYDLVVGGKGYKFSEGVYKSIFYKYEDKAIWGITAAILENFIKIIK